MRSIFKMQESIGRDCGSVVQWMSRTYKALGSILSPIETKQKVYKYYSNMCFYSIENKTLYDFGVDPKSITNLKF